MKQTCNWGGYPATPQLVQPLFWRTDISNAKLPKGPLLAHGNGRSQGDVGLNSTGTLLAMRGCNRLLAWDGTTGLLSAESGITLHEILEFAIPRGWMLPVVPGTRFVTLGGAIANDVHGKNHHQAIQEGGGSFGHHVRELHLWRSDDKIHALKPTDALFTATVGGLGLTGIITHAQVQLVPLPSARLQVRNVRCSNLGQMLEQLQTNSAPFSVAWLDLSAPEAGLGRGWLELADWVRDAEPVPAPKLPKLSVPFALPFNLWQPPMVKAFNRVWFKRPRKAEARVPYAKFFWPLDGMGNWRHLFGPASFVQCQFVVPLDHAETTLRHALQAVRLRGKPTFLNTLKLMGDHSPAGLISFPRAGVALALDMVWEGEKTHALLRDLEELVLGAGGAIYPAKDSCLSAGGFHAMYPHWRELAGQRDQRITSDFWQRVTGAVTEQKGAADA